MISIFHEIGGFWEDWSCNDFTFQTNVRCSGKLHKEVI